MPTMPAPLPKTLPTGWGIRVVRNQSDFDAIEWAPIKTILVVEYAAPLNLDWWDDQGSLLVGWLICAPASNAANLRDLRDKAAAADIPFWFAGYAHFHRCKRCGQTTESLFRAKYCGDGADKDNEHRWESIPNSRLDGVHHDGMPEEISSRILADFSELVTQHGPYSREAESFLEYVSWREDLWEQCHTVQLLSSAFQEKN